jgi:hypothetical protein
MFMHAGWLHLLGNMLFLGLWFILQWVYSAGYAASGAGSVAYLAHVFGFLTGAVVGLLARAAFPAAPVPGSPALPLSRSPAGADCMVAAGQLRHLIRPPRRRRRAGAVGQREQGRMLL